MHLGVSAGPLPGFSDSLHHYNHVLTFAKILGVFNSRAVTTLQASFGNSLILSLGARACECAVLSGCAIPGILVVAGPPTVRRFHRSRRCGACIGNACKSNRVSATLKLILGLRGLRLKVDIADRTGRLSLAFTMAYCNSAAEHARRDLEIPGRLLRHESCRTLSVLYLSTPGRFSKRRGVGKGFLQAASPFVDGPMIFEGGGYPDGAAPSVGGFPVS